MGLVLHICKKTSPPGTVFREAMNLLQLVKRTESVPLLFPIIDKFT